MRIFLLIALCLLLFTVGCSTVDTSHLIAVELNKKWGFIDTSGKFIIPPQFDSVHNFSDGLAYVTVDKSSGFINSEGKAVFPWKYPNASNGFSEGLEIIYTHDHDNALAGYIDTAGNIQIAPQFSDAYPFHEGLAAVCIGDKWGFIDKSGKTIIQPAYNKVNSFSEGYAAVAIGGEMHEDVMVGEKWGYIDKTGTMVIPAKFDGYDFPWTKMNFVNGIAAAQSGDAWGFIDTNGNFIIPAHFDKVFAFSDGVACVEMNEQKQTTTGIPYVESQRGFIDKSGKLIIPLQSISVRATLDAFSDGLVVAMGAGKKCGYMNKTGEMTIQPQYDRALPFVDGIAGVCIGNKWGFIDTTGKYVIQPQFEKVLARIQRLF